MTHTGFEFFWKPPRAGERILGIVIREGELFIATDDAVYTTARETDLMFRKIEHESIVWEGNVAPPIRSR